MIIKEVCFVCGVLSIHTGTYLSLKGDESSKALCLGCEVDDLFQQTYTGEVTPNVPSKILYALWNYADQLAGYQQQDAHEVSYFSSHLLVCACVWRGLEFVILLALLF